MTKIGSPAPHDAGFWDKLLHPTPTKLSTGLHGGSLAIQAGFGVWALYELMKTDGQKKSTLSQLGWGAQLLFSGLLGAFDLHQLIHAHKYNQTHKATIQSIAGEGHTVPSAAVLHMHG